MEAVVPVTYRDYQTRHDIMPSFHAGEEGLRWNFAMGTWKDAVVDAAVLAARSRFIRTCPADALALHGRSLGWPQAPGERVDEYRQRLMQSWHLAHWRGTNKGIIDALKLVLNPFIGSATPASNWIEVKESFTSGWGRQKNPGPGINPAKQRWFNVIIRHPHPFGTDFSFKYGDGTVWGGGKLWGINGDPRLLELLRMVVRRQKSAHSFCEWIAVVLAGDVIDANTMNDGQPLGGGASRVAYLKVRPV